MGVKVGGGVIVREDFMGGNCPRGIAIEPFEIAIR